jgi:hypothetical protein
MSELFWFTDRQWSRIEPLLPRNTRGMKRVDDRRVISGIVHVLNPADAGVMHLQIMARRKRFITASCAGLSAGYGKIFLPLWLGRKAFPTA